MATTELKSTQINQRYLTRFLAVRRQSLRLCEPLQTEDFVVQPITDVSPPKWHLAHTTWFFEVFVLVAYCKGYTLFHPDFPYLFNSYYVGAGDRWTRAHRGHLTRPTVQEIMEYRKHVDHHLERFLADDRLSHEAAQVIEIGLNHEQQHQELLIYDIKYIFGHNPLLPVYRESKSRASADRPHPHWLGVDEGVYPIGHEGSGFCFDNELGHHRVFLHAFEISNQLVNNGEYLEFVQDGGYEDHRFWLSEGWDWVNQQSHKSPMYWLRESGTWHHYTLGGLRPLQPDEPVAHVNYYEADAFAKWKGARLPTEFEWEVAARLQQPTAPENANFVEQEHYHPVAAKDPGFWGNLWEWTSSAYLPYPYYQAPEGALGEYNGKFMVNQMVLRGGSCATPTDHIRLTYRNFFHPHLQWMFSGIRLARHV